MYVFRVLIGEMASRLKEDERNERNIRNLMKLAENRRCINCNSLGPQYVCTSFWTFVCTTCSGIHREFTHRVKSVSMAKFTTQEVSALQGGGNASAKEIYLKEWDAQHQSLPDSSNVEKLRDFIKHVYVDRRYSGERSFDKPPRVKTGEAEDRYGSRSPPYENERRYSDRPSPGGRSDVSSRNSYDERRSPGYDKDIKKSPARVDIVNDWRREDRYGNTRSSDAGSKVEVRSPDREISSPPIVRPVRDILGDSVSPLRVIEPPRANGSRPVDVSLQTQRTVSSSSLASSNENPTDLRRENSLIDFDADPEPPSTAPVAQQVTPPAPATFLAPPSVSSNDNWASFDSSAVVKPSQAPSSGNLLDMLSDLSVPVSGYNHAISSVQVSPFGTTAPPVTPPSTFTPEGASFNAFAIQPPTSTSTFNQAWGGDKQGPASAPGVDSQVTSSVKAKPAAKQELPADLFTSSYAPFAAQGQSWYPAPQYGMGYNTQYNVSQQPMPPAFIQSSQPSNPFDISDSPAVQSTPFPSMASLQHALPHVGPPSGIHRTSSLGAPAQAWMPHQQSNPLAMPPQGTSYGSAMPSGPFMGQVPHNIPPQPRVGNFGYDMTSFNSMNPNQQQSGLYAASATTPNTFSSNPFG
ncbi:uncharacterized protein [Rutidosis leptorrhynchoides]|uniref:uncharacterized protein isoform X2 n=2 Tax=Rutidosis leptorrhynchoides TaxID=125765 RepID=UPI003A99B7C2